MAFQTSVLRDGEWVTETVNFHAALQHASAAAAASAPGPTLDTQATPPVCGILSRTVVESPIVHWVLPVRLRSKAHNDIAFIGPAIAFAGTSADESLQDHFVQINELRSDGQLHQVARKSDFGARIRSAAVLGDPLEHGLDDETSDALVKVEDSDSTMADVSEPLPAARDESLPPKLLVLVLDTGDIAFLFLRKSPRATLEFVVSKYKTPRKLSFLGFHLAVDPSSHYMAASSPDGVLAMYEINDMSTLNAQYKSTGTFAPVRSVRLRAINGVIHKLEFLYPRPADDYHIILILIIIRDDRRHPEPVTRMVTYEWEVGDNLKEVFADERLGNRLPKEHKLPLLLIPLKFNNAFFTVSPNFIGIVKDCLSGSPVFESLRTDPPSRTHLHHGANGPLWTAWSRPFRRRGYFERTDIIYLAREDGAIIHIEIEANDLVPSVTNVGCLDSNINTAFATAYDVFSDILIIGGDSGPGGVWKLAPRSELEQVSILPNWSPVVDAATDSPRSVISKAAAVPDDGRQSNSQKAMPRPENLFTASGRGLKGSVTQWRWGIQGRIGLDIETGEPIRQSWAFALEKTMGVAPVEVFPCSGPFDGTEAALMCCDNNLTMMTGLSPRSGTFRKKQSILLTDANDASMSPPVVHSVASLAWNISGYPGHMSLMVQAGSRLLLAEIWPHVGPVPRSIPIGGTPTRLIFSHTWNCLVVALLEGDRPTLAFIDPNSGETLSIPSDKDGNPSDFASGLGHPGDRIYGLYEWLYIKDGRTFSFILVATKDGRLLIISVNRVKSKASEGQSKRLLYWTRYKKVLGEPIYSIVGDDQGIIYCVDKVVHWEVLDLAEKRLRPMGEYRLDSPATSLQVVQGHIFALTTLHSLEIIDYKTGGMGDMALVHSDRITRRTTHMIDAGLPCGRSGSWPVTLLSDQKGGIAGVWVPWHQRNKEFEVVFEGLLPTAVRRFVALRSRPLWLAVGRDALYDTVPSTSRAADIVGVSLDGSLQHFTLVGIDLWRFLYLVQNMARRSPRVGPVATAAAPGATDSAGRQVMMEVDGGKGDYEHDDLEAKLHPRLMHIDGDVLERCLQVRALEKLVQDAGNLGRFCQCLDKLEGGQHTRGFKADLTNDGRSKYFGLAYEILGYLLDPVM
ncbi:thermotolerance protein [Purpureocillium lavendulum]|uniref:Thermotolerance protein n=1 Tax=Purpureocillium lavendulum TaxID=1247861 RepID=A0AB34FZR9_9HYPO|nr:thermotolerance protein [Purpureocillium lavendulum]